jgi:conjugal transfer pilus assembly protein TraU
VLGLHVPLVAGLAQDLAIIACRHRQSGIFRSGFWEPVPRIGLIGFEPVRSCLTKPGASVNLGGIKLDPGFDIGNGYASDGAQVGGKSQNTRKWHVHYYIYPLLYWMEMVTDFLCLEASSFDVAYMTEIDPLWQDDELAPRSSIPRPPFSPIRHRAGRLRCRLRGLGQRKTADRRAVLVRWLPGFDVSDERQCLGQYRPSPGLAARGRAHGLQAPPSGSRLGHDGIEGAVFGKYLMPVMRKQQYRMQQDQSDARW